MDDHSTMGQRDLVDWHDDHTFGQDQKRPGEMRTFIVIVITFAMMIVEILAGQIYESMALLADGLHMASHAAALSISLFAYIYARKLADDRSYNFGTGKVNALGGFAGAMLLGLFSVLMIWESVHRLIDPQQISFDEAIAVAFVGLLVNIVCALILGHQHDHGDDHGDYHGHKHDAETTCKHKHDHGEDHNLKAAYMHVVADLLTSVLAIAALFAGKSFGWTVLDPVIGVVGAVIVARWSLSLIRSTSDVLLDRQASEKVLTRIRDAIENEHHDVVDLHVWSIGPGLLATEIIIVSSQPLTPAEFKKLLPDDLSLAHAAVEVHRR
ncbi:MAG: CDF family Co(II)/Ni(II) efflux transporter DmeF [Pirellulaceae bacterium]